MLAPDAVTRPHETARVAGLPAAPHPSKLPTSSSIFESMLQGGAGRMTAFGDLSASLPPYLGPNLPLDSAGDGVYGVQNAGALGTTKAQARFNTHRAPKPKP